MRELFGWIALRISLLEQQRLDEAELIGLNNGLIVICKIIRADPQQYDNLTKDYIRTYHGYQSGELNLKFDSGSARAASKSSISQ